MKRAACTLSHAHSLAYRPRKVLDRQAVLCYGPFVLATLLPPLADPLVASRGDSVGNVGMVASTYMDREGYSLYGNTESHEYESVGLPRSESDLLFPNPTHVCADSTAVISLPTVRDSGQDGSASMAGNGFHASGKPALLLGNPLAPSCDILADDISGSLSRSRAARSTSEKSATNKLVRRFGIPEVAGALHSQGKSAGRSLTGRTLATRREMGVRVSPSGSYPFYDGGSLDCTCAVR